MIEGLCGKLRPLDFILYREPLKVVGELQVWTLQMPFTIHLAVKSELPIDDNARGSTVSQEIIR